MKPVASWLFSKPLLRAKIGLVLSLFFPGNFRVEMPVGHELTSLYKMISHQDMLLIHNLLCS
jgi:hypothetical protein